MHIKGHTDNNNYNTDRQQHSQAAMSVLEQELEKQTLTNRNQNKMYLVVKPEST